jgi:hypothetical protein
MTSVNRVACAACMAALGCVDYHYAHMVRGRVVAPDEARLTSIEVCRVLEPGIPEDLDAAVHGVRDLYCITLNEDGRFEFEYKGLGDKPVPSQIWHLVAIRAGQVVGTMTIEAKWIHHDDYLGYFADDVEIRIDGAE